MINDKDLNNQNLNVDESDFDESAEDIDAKNENKDIIDVDNEEANSLENDSTNYKSVEVVYNENNEPVIKDESNDNDIDENINVGQDISIKNTEELNDVQNANNDSEETSDQNEVSNLEEIELIDSVDSDKDNIQNEELQDEVLDPIVKDFINMKEINYDVHKLIYSNQFFSASEIAQTIKKELKVSTYDELVKTIKGSKYNKLFEVLGYFLYFTYKNGLSDDKKDSVLSELNNEEIICVYSFAISVANEYKEKQFAKSIYKDLKKVPYDGGFILKFSSMIMKKHLKDEYEFNDKKKKKIKKLVKKCKNHIKKSEVYSAVDEAIVRYIFNVYGEYYIKKCSKLFKKIETKLSIALKINCLLSLAKGYLKKTKYNKASKYYRQVILLDSENYESLIGNLLVLNKCVCLEELLSKKKLNKIKGYEDFKSVINNSTNDGLVAKSQEIMIKEKQAKKAHLDEKLNELRKHVSVVSITLAFILILLNVFINNTGVSVVSYLLLALYVGSSCITTNIKSNIKNIIIKSLVAVILIVLSIIF